MISKYLNELKINGRSENTIRYTESFLKAANEFKPLSSWIRDDTNNYILVLHKRYKKSSIEIIKAVIKRYFIWVGKEKIVGHLRIKIPTSELKREEILTPDDIIKLIDATESPMYKALIAFLFESGARINEVLAIKIDDIQETEKGMIISVYDTKTGKGYRRGLYPRSAQYIRNYINYSVLSKKDRLFDINDTSAWFMLKKLGNKASIGKPVTPHKFRHAQATHMVLMGYQESIIRKKFGWVDDSRMVARYQHIIDDDVINATAEKAGINISGQQVVDIKIVEPLKFADAAAMISKLAAENEELKEQFSRLKLQIKKISDLLEDDKIKENRKKLSLKAQIQMKAVH